MLKRKIIPIIILICLIIIITCLIEVYFRNDVNFPLLSEILLPIACVMLILIIAYLIYQCYPTEYKLLEESSTPPCGLRNTTETCYMNSMIQAVASSDVLINEYDSIIGRYQNVDNSSEKMKALVDLLKGINQSKPLPSNIQKNTDKLEYLMSIVNWTKTSQQDSFQLLSAFINGIQRDMKGILLENGITMPPKFKLLHKFDTDAQNNKVQDHLALALPLCGHFNVRPGVQLTTLLDAFFEPSVIDDGPEQTQMCIFENTPDVMIVHIQANEWDPATEIYIKPTYYIQYGDKFRYIFKVETQVDGTRCEEHEVEYELKAVVHHMGSVSGGHYITYRKLGQQWFLTNDEQVEEIPFRFDIVPYIMVYEKIHRSTN